MKREVKIAMMYFASATLTAELHDELKGTNLFKHKVKQLSKNLTKELDNIIVKFHNDLDNESEKILSKMINSIEIFVECIIDKEPSTIIALLEDLKNGDIMVVDENKHGKFLKQQNTL